VATKLRSDSGVPAPGETVVRFVVAVRIVHWINAAAFAVLAFTGAAMYGAPGTRWVGHRDVVRNVHLWVGLAMFVPLAAAFVASPTARDDVRRLARWTRDDGRWWFRSQRTAARLGKFNPGQKANASFTLAALITLLGTGAIMKWYGPFGDDWRTGATFVHDWTALVLGLVVAGHILIAFREPEALRGMTRGTVDAAWAERERPRWYAEGVAAASVEATTTPIGAHGPDTIGDSDTIGGPDDADDRGIDPAAVAERR